MSFSDVFRYASDTSSAGPIISDSTSRENVTEGRAGETGSGGFSSTYQNGVMECINDIKSINVRRSVLYDKRQTASASHSVLISKCAQL